MDVAGRAAGIKYVSPDSYERLLKTIDGDDPFEAARICPSDLTGVALCELPLTVRCHNVLVDMDISTIGQMQSIDLNDALGWANFGRKSALDLAKALQRFIASRMRSGSIPVSTGEENKPIAPRAEPARLINTKVEWTLMREMLEFASTLQSSQQKVFEVRVLNQKGLAEIGARLGVTRERARQIESLVVDRMAKFEWASSLTERISKLLAGRTRPLFLDGIEVEDPWFAGWSTRAHELAGLITALPSDLTALEIQGRFIVSRISADCFQGVLKNTSAFLAQHINERWARSDVERFVEGAFRAEKAPELAGFALDLLLPELHFASVGDPAREILCGVGRRVRQLIMAVLRSAEAPLHFSEVAAAVSERMGLQLSTRAVRARLVRIPALFFGRGRYGAECHYSLSEDVEVEVTSLLEDIMLVDPERQWHVAELIEALEAKGGDLPEILDKYLLDILLSRSRQFQEMGRMVWMLKSDGATETRGRIGIRESCLEILVEAGRPLNVREIKERLGRLRGTAEHLLIRPSDRITRLAPNQWGLVDRDFNLDREQRAQFLTELELELNRRSVSLHVSELSAILKAGDASRFDITGYMLMGIAQTDVRFKVHRGRLIALAAWNDARRLSVRSTVALCAQRRSEVAAPEFVAEVEAVVARKVERAEVTGLLLQMGWRRRGLTDTYAPFAGDEDESIEEGRASTAGPDASAQSVHRVPAILERRR